MTRDTLIGFKLFKNDKVIRLDCGNSVKSIKELCNEVINIDRKSYEDEGFICGGSYKVEITQTFYL